jgi:hypothetical protein
MAMPRRDFAVTLRDGPRVIGRQNDGGEGWSTYVYPPDSEGPFSATPVPALSPTRFETPDRPALRPAKHSAASADEPSPAGLA